MTPESPLAAIDRIDWTASGRERWLATAPIAALGLFSISMQAVYLLRADPTLGAGVVTAGIPSLLSLLILVAAVWLPGSEYGAYLPRIALWSLVGALVLVAIGQLVLLSQQVLGTQFVGPLFLFAYLQTTGTAIGLTVGLYDAASQDRKAELEEERQRAEHYAQQLSVLNRILRHDVRTGVQVIREYADLLPDPPDMEPTIPLARIRKRATEMYETAETTRELRRLMAARERLMDEMDVPAELRSAVETVRTEHPDAAINVDAPESARASAVKILELAFEELLVNAIEHHDSESPVVDVVCEAQESAVEVRIIDDGPGIPEKELEPIRQGGETPLVHSSGVGLWLANWIVEESDGTLGFDTSEATGTTVTVSLPR